MKPQDLSNELLKIAETIEKSENPSLSQIKTELNHISAKLEEEYIVSLRWLEPEKGSWVIRISDLSIDEIREVQRMAKKEAGEEWGVTIPSIKITKGVNPAIEEVSPNDFASAIRYDTGESIYSVDFPPLSKRGIIRQ